jgi:Protein of unknown function (DUF3309)
MEAPKFRSQPRPFRGVGPLERIVHRGTPRETRDSQEESSMGLILLIVLIVLLMGGLPSWNYSRNWGYGPSGGIGLLLVVLLILVVAGYVPRGF